MAAATARSNSDGRILTPSLSAPAADVAPAEATRLAALAGDPVAARERPWPYGVDHDRVPSCIELGVPDADRAVAFYGAVLGWTVDAGAGMTQVETPTLSIGIHGGDPGTHFEVMFAVPDIDAALAAVLRTGGEVVSPVTDSAGFGRWAECRDDQGVRFGLRQPT